VSSPREKWLPGIIFFRLWFIPGSSSSPVACVDLARPGQYPISLYYYYVCLVYSSRGEFVHRREPRSRMKDGRTQQQQQQRNLPPTYTHSEREGTDGLCVERRFSTGRSSAGPPPPPLIQSIESAQWQHTSRYQHTSKCTRWMCVCVCSKRRGQGSAW
jgi:hypothetical protein